MTRLLGLGFMFVAITALWGQPGPGPRPPAKTAENKAGWTSEEVLRQLARQGNDPYLQYVAIQLARREGRAEEVAERLRGGRRMFDPGRRERADLFNTFTGALAVQESLQLDTLLGEDDMRPGRFRPGMPGEMKAVPPPPRPDDGKFEDKPPRPIDGKIEDRPVRPAGSDKSKNPIRPVAPKKAENPIRPVVAEQPPERPPVARPKTVSIDTLTGPTVKSHPWEQMLAGRKPETGKLAQCVPDDFYLVEFKSVAKLLQALSIADLWGDHLFTQMLGKANSQDTERRLKKQLGIAGIPSEIIDAMGVEGIAVTGSDLYLADGSDVTLLVLGRQVVQMRQWADATLQRGGSAMREEGEYQGIKYSRTFTSDGEVNVYAADPRPDLHVRSNSLPAFRKVLAVIAGKGENGAPVRRLGDSTEFAYVRTILPRGDAEEDGIIYLSDPCIRRLVGPRVKLSQRRRLIAFNHLKMIEHAALMFRTETGRAPKSFEELAEAGCAPGVFGRDKLAHPGGGTYTLAADGMAATSSIYGRPGRMTPILEVPITDVTDAESAAYRQFLDEYNSYWRTFFDPIAVRVKVTPQQYRLETVILPLIDNSIYTTMAAALAGPPVPLDPLPASRKTILSVGVRLNKQQILGVLPPDPVEARNPQADGRTRGLEQSANNLRQILLAMHNHVDAFAFFPPADLRFAQPNPPRGGKPQLSWRVALLPYLEQDELYRAFKHDEPWDSEHNTKLIEKIPSVYRGRDFKLAASGKTPFVGVVGRETVFPPDGTKLMFPAITDGTANTIAVVEAIDDQAVIWTKPDDLPIDPKEPLRGLIGPGRDSFLAAMCDGSVRHIRGTIPADTVRAMFTRAGGEIVDVRPEHTLPVPGMNRSGPFDLSEIVDVQKLRRFLKDGVGDQVALHVLDAAQPIGSDVTGLFGTSGAMQGLGLRGGVEEMAAISLFASTLTNPVCLSLPVRDAKAVDEFLDELDRVISEKLPREFDGFVRHDLYRLAGRELPVRCLAFKVLGFSLRICWGRVGNLLCVVNHPSVLDDIGGSAGPAGSAGQPAHAILRVRPENWNAVLPVYRLAWAEGQRNACQANLTRIGNVARGWPELGKGGEVTPELLQRVAQLYGVRPYCPDLGKYTAADGTCACSVHGSWNSPRQPSAPNEESATAKTVRAFGGLGATLTFREDGLHAAVTIERK